MPLIEIAGDVWLLADIIGIKLNEPEDEEDDWEIVLIFRNADQDYDAPAYYYPEDKAKKKHLELIEAWKKWLTS